MFMWSNYTNAGIIIVCYEMFCKFVLVTLLLARAFGQERNSR